MPLGPRDVLAVVWADNANPDPRLHNRLKEVSEKLDLPPLKPELRGGRRLGRQLHAVAARHGAAHVPADGRESRPRAHAGYGVRLVGTDPPKRLTPARQRLIAVLSDGLLHGKSEAAKEAGVSTGVIDGLVDEGTLTVEPMPPPAPPPAPDPDFGRPDFSPLQRAAVDTMRALAANGTFHVALLDGVTGSGKTEVYFEAVAEIGPARQAVADPDAGDRADRPVSRSLRAALRRAAASNGIRS